MMEKLCVPVPVSVTVALEFASPKLLNVTVDIVELTVTPVGGVKANAAPVAGLISDCVHATPEPAVTALVIVIVDAKFTQTLRRSATAAFRANSTAAFN